MTTTMIAWHCTMRTPLTTSTDIHMSVVRTVSHLVLSASHHPHTHRGSRCLSLSCHLHSHGHLSVSPRLDSPFLFPALPHVPYLLPPDPEFRGKLAQLLQREYGLHLRVLPLHSSRLHVRIRLEWICTAHHDYRVEASMV